MTHNAMWEYEDRYMHVSVYEINHKLEKQLVLVAPTIKEAEQAFDELRIRLDKYKTAKIHWQYTYLPDEVAVGEII